MGEQHYKRSVKKFMFISNFLRGFFTMKVVENSPKNAQNCIIFKNFLGGKCPHTPLAKACSFAARGMYIQNLRNFKVEPPPLRNPAYAPVFQRLALLMIFSLLIKLATVVKQHF